MTKLPDFHTNSVIKNYDLGDDEDDFDDEDSDNGWLIIQTLIKMMMTLMKKMISIIS